MATKIMLVSTGQQKKKKVSFPFLSPSNISLIFLFLESNREAADKGVWILQFAESQPRHQRTEYRWVQLELRKKRKKITSTQININKESWPFSQCVYHIQRNTQKPSSPAWTVHGSSFWHSPLWLLAQLTSK